MFRKIIVGCDSSDQSYDALALATQLAELSGAGLMLVHVYDQQPAWFSHERTYEREQRAKVEAILEPAVKTVPDSIRVLSLGIGSGSPARGLHDLAEGERADLVVLGSTHRGAAGRVLPGSVADALLNGAPCAVAIAPSGYRDQEVHDLAVIGAGFDGSDESERVLGAADRLADALGAPLRAMAAAESRQFRRDNGTTQHPLEDRLAEALTALGRSPDDGVLLEGPPAEVLAEAAGDLDLLVAGSRGYGPLHHVFTGSVTGPLMRTCPCPMLVMTRSAPAPA